MSLVVTLYNYDDSKVLFKCHNIKYFSLSQKQVQSKTQKEKNADVIVRFRTNILQTW